MKRRLINAWMFLSVAWILYGAYYAVSYWWNWGDFISPENRVSVWIVTVIEILAAPVLGGIVLFSSFAIINGVRLLRTRYSRNR